MDVQGVLNALLTDPTYGIPLIIALGLTGTAVWWSRARTAALPDMAPGVAPETWRMRSDSLAYFALQQGQFLGAVDGLGRRLAVVARDEYHVHIGHRMELDSPAIDRRLPRPLTLRGLVDDLTEAYNSAARAEQPEGLARRWTWLHERDQQRAARQFAKVTKDLSIVLPALEEE